MSHDPGDADLTGILASCDEPLFVWQSRSIHQHRLDDSVDDSFPRVRHGDVVCPYCDEPFRPDHLEVWNTRKTQVPFGPVHEEEVFSAEIESLSCDFCGYFESTRTDPSRWWEELYTRAGLYEFEINDLRVPLEYVGAYLHRHVDRLQDLAWRRFEELLRAMFREQGFSVVMGRGTKDSGVDLVLLEAVSGKRTLVQAKRRKRRVGVEAVRELRGVQLRENVRAALLVATGGFTSGAKAEAHATVPRKLGFRLDLMAATEIVRELGIFRAHDTSLVQIDRLRSAYRDRRPH